MYCFCILLYLSCCILQFYIPRLTLIHRYVQIHNGISPTLPPLHKHTHTHSGNSLMWPSAHAGWHSITALSVAHPAQWRHVLETLTPASVQSIFHYILHIGSSGQHKVALISSPLWSIHSFSTLDASFTKFPAAVSNGCPRSYCTLNQIQAWGKY